MSLLDRQRFSKSTAESNRVNVGEEDELVLTGYMPSLLRLTCLVIGCILSGGVLVILCSWRPSLKARIANRRCSLEQARLLILKDKYGKETIETVHTSQRDRSFSFRYFCHKKLKYIWNSEFKHFERLRGLESERCAVIYSQVVGATSSEASLKLDLYGANSIEIEVLPIWRLVLDEITGPFYLYQFFICSIWLIQLYYQFATCILLLSIVSVATHVWQTRKQSIALRQQVQSASRVEVIRDGSQVSICSTELVPGDVLVLARHCTGLMLECDAVLMTGSCIVDESMLTGESVPVPKVALVEDSNSFYSPTVHKSNTLFSGTRVLTTVQSSKECDLVKAVVVRTGFSTTKGELARSILFPVTANNNLKRQLIKMSAIFFLIGIPCMVYTVYALSRFAYATYDIFIIVLDVATFLIPPVLPAVLTSINVHAQRRLKTKDIYCLNPRMISCSGEIDVMCFDKTGTLTDDTIEFAGVVPASGGHFAAMQTDMQKLAGHSIVRAMAACHSLVEYEGKVEGDDLDLKLFTASGWRFIDNYQPPVHSDLASENNNKSPERVVASADDGSHTMAILKQFPFESFLQRMLVIARDSQTNTDVAIVKGAPEIVASFCTSQSIPQDFLEVFESYTRKGFRVLATATKAVGAVGQDVADLSRNDIECQMDFVGLYLFKNKLKEATYEVLQELRRAQIRCIMATGDNLLTGISVAEECRLVDHSDAIIKVRAQLDKTKALRVHYSYVKYPDFVLQNDDNANFELGDGPESGGHFDYHLAIDGDSYNAIRGADPQLLSRIVHKGTIFARMSPDHKRSLVSLLQKQNHSVGMCGDGANDCGALRAADAGISLSVAEASVASPFTYKQKDISCVPALLKEGRCTLAAIFGAFKYQVCYCYILLGTVLILFWYGTKPAEGQYVFVDIILNILPPMLFGTTRPYKRLVPTMPFRNILSIVPQLSMYTFILVQVAVYYFVSQSVQLQPWYEPMKANPNNIIEPPTNHLAYAVFSANMMSYVISAIIFAPGPPYREHFFSNKKYIFVVVLNFLLIGLATLIAPSFLIDYLQFQAMPFYFRLRIFLISIGNFVICFLWEKYFLEHLLRQAIAQLKRRMKVKSEKRFKAIEEEIKADNWPFNNVVTNGRDRTANEPVVHRLTRFSSEDRL